jgi:S-adenosylmethionine:tRNA ribosyltransferase-isomerase
LAASRAVRVDDFDFPLPPRAIAQRPAEPRDAARLLVVGAQLHHARIADLPSLLRGGDVLVVNDTKVSPSRLRGRRDAVVIEATLQKRQADGCWRALVRPAKRLRPGQEVAFDGGITARVVAKDETGAVVFRFDAGEQALARALEAHGAMPLPPYIRRERPDPRDRHNYQTIFARQAGAVAAPTAGLHFTPPLLDRLRAAGIELVRVTLHVGAATFQPVRAATTEGHVMHGEWGELSAAAAAAINGVRHRGGRIIAVGTTSLRLLETAAAASGELAAFSGETRLFITPGYRFRAVDRLLTNFHLPRSTLFMLVAAFSGLERMKAAYAEAVARGYRFYSYGDACLLTPESEL